MLVVIQSIYEVVLVQAEVGRTRAVSKYYSRAQSEEAQSVKAGSPHKKGANQAGPRQDYSLSLSRSLSTYNRPQDKSGQAA